MAAIGGEAITVVRRVASLDELFKVLGKSFKSNAPVNAHRVNIRSLPERKLFFDYSFFVHEVGKNQITDRVCSAVLQDRALQVSLITGESEVIMPLGLVFSAGQWLLVQMDLGKSISTVPLRKFKSVLETDLTFKPPRDFKIEHFSFPPDFDGSYS